MQDKPSNLALSPGKVPLYSGVPVLRNTLLSPRRSVDRGLCSGVPEQFTYDIVPARRALKRQACVLLLVGMNAPLRQLRGQTPCRIPELRSSGAQRLPQGAPAPFEKRSLPRSTGASAAFRVVSPGTPELRTSGTPEYRSSGVLSALSSDIGGLSRQCSGVPVDGFNAVVPEHRTTYLRACPGIPGDR